MFESLVVDCIDVLVYTVRCFDEIHIYNTLKQNSSQFITVQQFNSLSEWEQHRYDVESQMQNIEIIETPEESECVVL